jgi:hypothetical protein
MFRRFSAGLCGWAAFALLAACAPQKPVPDPADVLAARQAALAFDNRMKLEILDRLEREEDPVAVYLAYRDHVSGWAKETGDKLGVDFSRTALRTRNPANAPDEWETNQMELFEFSREAGVDPATMEVAEIVTEGKQKIFRWIRPLVMGETCMACHGEEIDARLVTLLSQEYPLDDAVDYLENDLGGAYSVRKVLDPAGPAAATAAAASAPPPFSNPAPEPAPTAPQ